MRDRISEKGTESTNILKDKTSYFEKANGKIELKRSQKYFYQIQGQVSQLKRVSLYICNGKNLPLYVETVTFDENF